MFDSKYIEFSKGNIPIIISVPHGGTLKPKNISDRIGGVKGIDKHTIQLAKEFIKLMKKISKNKSLVPSYVFCNIARIKIDINRPESKAFNKSCTCARNIYGLYHQKLTNFISYNISNFNQSILLDLHGFETQRRPHGFRDVDVIIGTNNLKSVVSSKKIPKRDWGRNLRGRLIKKFIEEGIEIAPGHHLRKEYVLKGGFITQNYGASKIEKSKVIQIELSDRVRVVDYKLRSKILQIVAKVLYQEIIESI